MPPRSQPSPPVRESNALDQALALLQQRVDQLHEELAQQNKLATLGMVAAVLAHEFNNILTPMISYTKFALTEKSDDALRAKALEKALAGSQRLANISQSLLGFVRDGGGGDQSSTANILHAVHETLICLARDLAKDGITLTLDIPETLAVAINPGQLQQVLMNLIVNARSAMLSASQCGPKRLAIKAEKSGQLPVVSGQKDEDFAASTVDRFVTITLADTGPGIPAAILPQIFKPFFSTKSHEPAVHAAEDSLPRGGTGLGLAICQELITAAQGRIRVDSHPGQGATFTLELPLAQPATPES